MKHSVGTWSLFSATLVMLACSEGTGDTAPNSNGLGGTGGSSGTGGSAGTAGTAGGAGMAGTGGSAGGAGTSGAAGLGGGAGSGGAGGIAGSGGAGGGSGGLGGSAGAGGLGGSAGGGGLGGGGTGGVSGDPACGITISAIALYQAVKITLMEGGASVPDRSARIIQQRQALVRVFATPSGAAHPVIGVLKLESSSGTTFYTDTRSLAGPSSDAAMDSTFNFAVPAESVQADTAYSVSLTEAAPCGTPGELVTFPTAGAESLAATATGIVQLTFVRVETPGMGELASDQAQADRMAADAHAQYPSTQFQVSIRPQAVTSSAITWDDGASWSAVLGDVRAAHSSDGAASNMHYYGLVAPTPAADFGGGIVGVAGRSNGQSGVGIGVSYGADRLGEISPETFSHELGHMHGQRHIACNGEASTDENYPNHPTGELDVWGWDPRSGDLYDPAEYKDLMSYCGPTWVSAYNYDKWTDVILSSQRPEPVVGPRRRWFMAFVDGRGVSRWLNSYDAIRPGTGTKRGATVVDRNGGALASVPVYVTELDDVDGYFVDVASPAPTWHALIVDEAQPLVFSAHPSP